MAKPGLEILSNEALVELGAQLEVELASLEVELSHIAALVAAERRHLLRPGLKLALSASAGIAGLALAPVTLGWSLIATIVSSGVTIWDTLDLGRDARTIIRYSFRIRSLRTDVEAIVHDLQEIEHLLTRRLDFADGLDEDA